ncbi:MAG: hypothetical protein CMH28_09230 [Micavibrio sp.]|nr:hypothetical protein [Micavibrio sp.]
MKKRSILFLQAVVILIALLSLAILIRFPLSEGRAENLDLFHIYTDPFIIYGYISSMAFFMGLYKAFQLLRYIRQNKLFTPAAIGILKNIRFCAIVIAVFIVLGGIYIRFNHHENDDPAGFLALCTIMTFVSLTVAVIIAVLEKALQNAIDMKSENDLTI